jgi:creatinine amidohydrolase/Fe(II)-dependent formamide hydrolase-like protein
LIFLSNTSFSQALDFKKLSTTEIGQLDKENTTVIIPGGLLEEHGP